jgi:hypothetical protein
LNNWSGGFNKNSNRKQAGIEESPAEIMIHSILDSEEESQENSKKSENNGMRIQELQKTSWAKENSGKNKIGSKAVNSPREEVPFESSSEDSQPIIMFQSKKPQSTSKGDSKPQQIESESSPSSSSASPSSDTGSF